jgi:hypothetical protein
MIDVFKTILHLEETHQYYTDEEKIIILEDWRKNVYEKYLLERVELFSKSTV